MKIFKKTIFFLIFFNFPAFAWQRFEAVDDFSDAKTIGYLQKSSNSVGGFLIMSCDENIKFEWDPLSGYAPSLLSKSSGSPKLASAPRAAYPANNDTILFKTEDGSVRREKWLFDSQHETFYPEDLQKFLAQIKGKSSLRIKNEQLNHTGIFNISKIDVFISNLKALCKFD
jgi:hypothetical protein